MPPSKLRAISIGLMVCIGLLAACQDPAALASDTLPTPTIRPTPKTAHTPTPTITSTPTLTLTPTRTPTITPQPFTWESIDPGISRALVPVYMPGTDVLFSIYALRIDPTRTTLQVIYDRNARFMDEWQQETNAAVVINAGFFSGLFDPIGRLITDSTLLGAPLDYGEDSIGVPGMFAVIDDIPEMFVLGRGTMSPRGLQFDQAVECYPILLLPGGQPTFPEETGNIARRSIIGIDREGYILLIVIDQPIFSLYETARWLAVSGLNLDMALNLDGGRSTGLAVTTAGDQRIIPSGVRVPSIIAIYSR